MRSLRKTFTLPQDGFSHVVIPVLGILIFAALASYTFLRISHASTGDKLYTFKSGIAGKCLDDYAQSAINGTKVDIYTCNNTAAQQWSMQKNGSTIMLVNTNGACLDNYGNKNANHNPVIVYTCNKNDAAQQWLQVGTALKNPATGKCLDDPYSTTVDGTQLGIYTCNGTGAQQWTAVAVSSSNTGGGAGTGSGSGSGSGSGTGTGTGTGTGSGGSSSTPTTGSPTTATCSGAKPVAPVNGYSLAKCEDFNNGLGAFGAYSGGGGGTVVGSGRVASQCSATGGYLRMLQSSNGATCGGWMNGFSQRYGLWEVRMKAASTGTSGSAPHPVLILWPEDGNWTSELDWFETNLGDSAGGYLHCTSKSGNASGNCYVLPSNSVDYSQWHTYSFVWTASSMSGYIDGQQWWSTTNTSSFQPLGASNLTIQLDNLTGKTPVKTGEMDIDWAHMFKG
jgi:hypothetical protein